MNEEVKESLQFKEPYDFSRIQREEENKANEIEEERKSGSRHQNRH